MNNRKEQKVYSKRDEGITLFALIITIIVLLILAMVSIATVSNNNIISHAQEAKTKWEEATAEEEQAINNSQDYLSMQIAKVSGNRTSVWTLAVDHNANGEADVGDEVTSSAGESFYVIMKDTRIVTLLSKYNLATSKNDAGKYYQQNATYSTTACAFADDDSPYWEKEINSATGYSEGDAQEKAITYGSQNGGIGRLLTGLEAEELGECIETIIYGYSSTDGYLNYWLGSAVDGHRMERD